MTRTDRDERVERLRAARQSRASEALANAHRAITLLENRGKAVTFASVAEEADVSTSYLRKSEELSARIKTFAGTRSSTPAPAPASANAATIRGLRNKVEVMSERLRRLEVENTTLQAENAVLRGEVADARRRARPRRSEVS